MVVPEGSEGEIRMESRKERRKRRMEGSGGRQEGSIAQ